MFGDTKVSWLRGVAGQTKWAMWPEWVWWPLYSALAIVEANGGRPAAARNWLTKIPYPPPLDKTIEAYIEYAEGNKATARELALQVLAGPSGVLRGQLLALGVVLSVPASASPEPVEVALASVEWADALDTVALFPPPAKKLIIERLNLPPGRYPGLTLEVEDAAPASVSLTARQLEVLRALDSTLTLGEIARNQYVGVETVGRR